MASNGTAPKNPCSKTVKPEQAYEVYQCQMEFGTVNYYVCKKYQSPENEAKNREARWFTYADNLSDPWCSEYGDMYAADIARYGLKLPRNPKTGKLTPVQFCGITLTAEEIEAEYQEHSRCN
jgi:hypothetical protein